MSKAEELLARKNNACNTIDRTIERLDGHDQEIERLYSVAVNTSKFLNDLEDDFSKKTSLGKRDIEFLFTAILLQCIRIYVINTLTKIEPAGNENAKEGALHKLQNKLLGKVNNGALDEPTPYYAPLIQICTTKGVPYDATRFKSLNPGFFKKANHRFATFGHDPLIGLVLGTTNILTNTITCRSKEGVPIPITCHVEYNASFKNPCIGDICSTIETFHAAYERIGKDNTSVVAALIKQVIHIGTDLYTPKGIQIPGANLILTNKYAEELTKYISFGDVVKIGASYKIYSLINVLISSLHMLTCESTIYRDRTLHHVNTLKILHYSNIIATGSNVIKNTARASFENVKALKDIDFAGLIGTIIMLFKDKEKINEIKREFILSEYEKIVLGDSYSPVDSFLLKLK